MEAQSLQKQSKDKHFNISRNRTFTMFQNLLDWTLAFWEKSHAENFHKLERQCHKNNALPKAASLEEMNFLYYRETKKIESAILKGYVLFSETLGERMRK